MTATAPGPLAVGDFLRAPALAHARPGQVKEWHHFVVYRQSWRMLVNVSLTDESVPGGGPRFAPRVSVIAHDDRWTGAVRRFDDADLHISPDLRSLAIGGNRITAEPGGYRLTLALPDDGIEGELCLTGAARPFVVVNQPVGDGRLSWLLVPRMQATGRVRVGGAVHELAGAAAYHDHNWGRFRWGDDFGWEWSSVLASDAHPWSFVFSRLTDRRRLRVASQKLFVWHGTQPAAMFRDSAITVRRTGRLDRPPDITLPPPMNLVLGGTAADVPAAVSIEARLGGDRVGLEFAPRSFARIALPSEVDLDRAVVLTESAGSARASGTIGGEELDVDGAGIFEVLHG